ncbi:hemicentin-1-like [Planococcus citri]|uniref:hemicentin-1-like n=1 Tax=Planococcus citri TaxID=170843 RepID=UPI0031F9777C
MLLKIVVAVVAFLPLILLTDQKKLSAPVITLRPKDFAIPFPGQRVYVTCDATGEPIPALEFGKLPRFLTDKPGKRPLVNGNGSIFYLIPSIQRVDEGDYYCDANNSVGYDSQMIQIYLNETGLTFDRSNMTIEPSTFTGMTEYPILLNCSVESTVPAKITWSRFPNLPVWPFAKMIDNGKGLLFIESAREEDSAVYLCTAVAEENGDPLIRKEVLVTILPNNGTSPKRVIFDGSKIEYVW